jgi:hypothetical protein
MCWRASSSFFQKTFLATSIDVHILPSSIAQR